MRWNNLTSEYVRTATLNGERLVLLFAADFKARYNRDICISCISQFNTDFQKYKYDMSEVKSEYKLKPKYNNIILGFGRNGRLSNERMNEEDAAYLLATHPLGAALFEKLPAPKPIIKEVKKEEKKEEKKKEVKKTHPDLL